MQVAQMHQRPNINNTLYVADIHRRCFSGNLKYIRSLVLAKAYLLVLEDDEKGYGLFEGRACREKA
jgi:hypothetical protein